MSTSSSFERIPTGDRSGATKRAVVIVNGASGRGSEGEVAAEQAHAALEEAGWSAVASVARPDELESRLDAATAEGPELLVVGGGDGTILAGAEAAMRSGAALGIIPLGTMNLLAKDLGLPLDPARAPEVFRDGETTTIDVGRVGDRTFLHSSLLGLVPRAGREREQIRDATSFAEQIDALARTAYAAATTPPLRLRLRAQDWEEQVETFSLAVTNNTLDMSLTSGFRRTTLTGGRLGVYLMTQSGPLGRMSMLFSLGSGVWKVDSEVASGECTELTVDSDEGELLVSNDGELAPGVRREGFADPRFRSALR